MKNRNDNVNRAIAKLYARSVSLGSKLTDFDEFNEKKTKYDFVMSETEAKAKVEDYYSGQIQVSETEVVTELRAAQKSYHASQLGVNPEDYGVSQKDLQIINEIGLYKYAQTGKPLHNNLIETLLLIRRS